MKIIVDADACPVKNEIVTVARKYDIEVVMVCDTSHIIYDGYSKVITVDKGSDSADFKIINISEAGDIVVTGDYGVAAMALSKGAKALGNSGAIYTDYNIDSFLVQRHMAKENRRKGGRFQKNSKRTGEADAIFAKELKKLLSEIL